MQSGAKKPIVSPTGDNAGRLDGAKLRELVQRYPLLSYGVAILAGVIAVFGCIVLLGSISTCTSLAIESERKSVRIEGLEHVNRDNVLEIDSLTDQVRAAGQIAALEPGWTLLRLVHPLKKAERVFEFGCVNGGCFRLEVGPPTVLDGHLITVIKPQGRFTETLATGMQSACSTRTAGPFFAPELGFAHVLRAGNTTQLVCREQDIGIISMDDDAQSLAIAIAIYPPHALGPRPRNPTEDEVKILNDPTASRERKLEIYERLISTGSPARSQ